jgi:chorismate synthase
MASQLGTLFRISTFGESHGPAVGVTVDGCPPYLPLNEQDIQQDLDRRRPGQSRIVTQRKEEDSVEILSGIEEGLTTGAPIALLVRNADARSRDYGEMREKYRPSHADFAYDEKYGIRSWAGGGRSSARETIGRVAAGAIASKLLTELYGVRICAWVERVQEVETDSHQWMNSTREQVDSNIIRCPDPEAAEKMISLIEKVRKEGDSVGGAIFCCVHGVPSGWGEPVFDRLEADLAKAVLSLPASKAFEVGSGMAGTYMKGSEHNDPYVSVGAGRAETSSNRSGGIQGGISNGMPLMFRVGFKPVATVLMEQETVDRMRNPSALRGKGRHDPCVLPRAVPMVEAMTALVLADHALRQEAILAARNGLISPGLLKDKNWRQPPFLREGGQDQ